MGLARCRFRAPDLRDQSDPPLNYASVCAGICAATVAWKPLGWRPVFFSEYDPETEQQFPAQVLAHHYPGVPNHGDLTQFSRWPYADIDVLVGGTPCQGFSIAGKREGMADPRSALALSFLGVARDYHPRWVVWENVPGVLSANDGADFHRFVRALAELGYGCAYRILDAQFFGVAQRRRRVFVVGCLRNWAASAAVLFERPSLQWNPPPRRAPGENPAPTLADGSNGGGANGPGRSVDSADSLQVVGTLWAGRRSAEGAERSLLIPDVSNSLSARDGKGQATNCYQGPPLVVDLVQATSPDNRSNSRPGDPAPALASTSRPIAFHARQDPDSGDVTHPLDTDGTSIGVSGPFGVRRLTPRECERLQGFPDDFTRIPMVRRGDKVIAWAKDSPRYKAIGNSMAVPVMRWIGEGIALVDSVLENP